MYSDSGVVTRICGARLRRRARSGCGVSPVRTAVRISSVGQAELREFAADARERRLAG